MCVSERARHIGCGSSSNVACCCCCNVASATCKSNCQPGCWPWLAVPHESQKLETDLKLEMPQTRCDSSRRRRRCRCRHDVWHLFPASNSSMCVWVAHVFLNTCTHLARCPISGYSRTARGDAGCSPREPSVGVNCWQRSLAFYASKNWQ